MNGFEQVEVRRGERSGATMAVAVHSTALGPALGGARMWHYPHDELAVADARLLAAAMTLKASAAGLDLGGGKGVIALPRGERPEGSERRALLLDFGDLVESLGGSYVTAEDVGTGADDMAVIAERTAHVVGLARARGGSGDPSPLTALGVLAAMRACAGARFGTRELAGHEVTIVGLGHVGGELAELLATEGVTLAVSDIDPSRRAIAEQLGARWIEPAVALSNPCEILAPCALGGILDTAAVESLRCEVVCGAANNVLAGPATAELLSARGILYAPDFIVNSGGLISVYAEFRGRTPEWVRERTLGIEQLLERVFAEAAADGVSPLRAAEQLARRRLTRGRPVGAGSFAGVGRAAS
jgi:leucine dehydrogenase